MFRQEDWRQHKGTDRYFRHIATMPRCAAGCAQRRRPARPRDCRRRAGPPRLTARAARPTPCARRRSSRTVQAVLGPTALCFVQTLAIALYATQHPAGWPDVPRVTQEFFNLTGGSLSLLLVFRTDASYTRWDEARQQWGCVWGCAALRRAGAGAALRKAAARRADAARRCAGS